MGVVTKFKINGQDLDDVAAMINPSVDFETPHTFNDSELSNSFGNPRISRVFSEVGGVGSYISGALPVTRHIMKFPDNPLPSNVSSFYNLELIRDVPANIMISGVRQRLLSRDSWRIMPIRKGFNTWIGGTTNCDDRNATLSGNPNGLIKWFPNGFSGQFVRKTLQDLWNGDPLTNYKRAFHFILAAGGGGGGRGNGIGTFAGGAGGGGGAGALLFIRLKSAAANASRWSFYTVGDSNGDTWGRGGGGTDIGNGDSIGKPGKGFVLYLQEDNVTRWQCKVNGGSGGKGGTGKTSNDGGSGGIYSLPQGQQFDNDFVYIHVIAARDGAKGGGNNIDGSAVSNFNATFITWNNSSSASMGGGYGRATHETGGGGGGGASMWHRGFNSGTGGSNAILENANAKTGETIYGVDAGRWGSGGAGRPRNNGETTAAFGGIGMVGVLA